VLSHKLIGYTSWEDAGPPSETNLHSAYTHTSPSQVLTRQPEHGIGEPLDNVIVSRSWPSQAPIFQLGAPSSFFQLEIGITATQPGTLRQERLPSSGLRQCNVPG